MKKIGKIGEILNFEFILGKKWRLESQSLKQKLKKGTKLNRTKSLMGRGAPCFI